MGISGTEAEERARRLVPVLAERAAKTESLRRLPDETFADLVASGLFRITQPSRFGGSELGLTDAFRVVNQLSRGCGSTGWTYALLTSHGWFLSLFPDEAQHEVWDANPDAVMSTSFSGGVPPQEVPGGWRIGEGAWRFSTGVHHASWVALLAPVITGPGEPPDMRFLLVPRAEVEIIEDWRAAGLAGSGSCSVVARDILVPGHRVLRLADVLAATTPGREVNDGPLYKLPLVGSWQVFLTTPATGIARAAMDAWITRTKSRVHPYTRAPASGDPIGLRHLGEAAARIEAAETLIEQVTRRVTDDVMTTGTVADETRARGRRDYAFAVRLCVEAVEGMFLAAGASTLDESSPIQRCWRDVHAVAQHTANNLDVALRSWGERALGIGDGLRFG
ncbi:MAG TPA: acyl-CoA dehydrogenase family protein [Trebonia sp.]|nr:acyl-CoA dehydrogenase family protein [Trebonia sp.]